MHESFEAHHKRQQLPALVQGEKPVTEFDGAKYASSWLYQFQLLIMRSVRLTMREKANNMAELGQTITFSILMGLIWLEAGSDLAKEGSVQSVAGS